MSYSTIEEYFNQFPDDVEVIDVEFISDHLPDLMRFYKLKRLECNNNKLTYLPPLPSVLEELVCGNNELTYLPHLPYNLDTLYFINNPKMDYYIQKGKSTMLNYIAQLNKQINIINKFRELFYTVKCKKQLHKWLWVRVREPKIQQKYHPSNLITMLEGREEDEMSLDELDELLEKW